MTQTRVSIEIKFKKVLAEQLCVIIEQNYFSNVTNSVKAF